MRKAYVEKFASVRPLLDQASKGVDKVGGVASRVMRRSKGSSGAGLSQLTKNALQNVVQYFRPWGRDFCVLRGINKRFKAAYHDHLQNILNID